MKYYVVKFYNKNGDLAGETVPWRTVFQEAVDDVMRREKFERYEIIELTEEESDRLLDLKIKETRNKRGGRIRETHKNQRLH